MDWAFHWTYRFWLPSSKNTNRFHLLRDKNCRSNKRDEVAPTNDWKARPTPTFFNCWGSKIVVLRHFPPTKDKGAIPWLRLEPSLTILTDQNDQLDLTNYWDQLWLTICFECTALGLQLKPLSQYNIALLCTLCQQVHSYHAYLQALYQIKHDHEETTILLFFSTAWPFQLFYFTKMQTTTVKNLRRLRLAHTGPLMSHFTHNVI